MIDHAINVAGIEIPSSDPIFLAVVGVHVLLGLVCTITGVIAMLSIKRVGPHPSFGSIYFWCLGGVFVTAAGLSAVRWLQDYDLLILGASAFAAAYLGRTARRKRWNSWVWWHISGMGMSYILLLTAFYVDNGRNLPLWRNLPSIAYWLLPAAVGIPLIVRALFWHPLARAQQRYYPTGERQGHAARHDQRVAHGAKRHEEQPENNDERDRHHNNQSLACGNELLEAASVADPIPGRCPDLGVNALTQFRDEAA